MFLLNSVFPLQKHSCFHVVLGLGWFNHHISDFWQFTQTQPKTTATQPCVSTTDLLQQFSFHLILQHVEPCGRESRATMVNFCQFSQL